VKGSLLSGVGGGTGEEVGVKVGAGEETGEGVRVEVGAGVGGEGISAGES
jgi:hypothetical protein